MIEASGPGRRPWLSAVRVRYRRKRSSSWRTCARPTPGGRAGHRCGRARGPGRSSAAASTPVEPAGDGAAFGGQRRLGRRPAASISPTTFVTGTRTSSRNTSAKWASPVIWRSGRGSMPGVRHVDEQVGDPLALRHIGIGSDEEDPPLGPRHRRRPHLLAGDHELVAVADRTGAEGGEIRSGTGLGEQLAPQLVAPQHRGQETGLLLGRPVAQQGRAHHAEGDDEGTARHPERGLLLVEDRLEDRRVPLAAGRRGPGERGPARHRAASAARPGPGRRSSPRRGRRTTRRRSRRGVPWAPRSPAARFGPRRGTQLRTRCRRCARP